MTSLVYVTRLFIHFNNLQFNKILKAKVNLKQ